MKNIIAISILAVFTTNVMAGTPPTTGELGRVSISYWTNIPYSSVDDLTSLATYPNQPNSREYSAVMEIPQNLNTNSGDLLQGFFYVPTTGTYTFAIASSASSQLWFSTDSNPSHATEIASVSGSTGYQKWYTSSTQTYTTSLTANEICYIKAIHKTGTGSSNMSVGLQPPGTGTITLMKTTNVAPYDPYAAYSSYAIDAGIQTQQVVQGTGTVTGTITEGVHPRLLISPASINRIVSAIATDPNQSFSWGRISNVVSGSGTDLMPMGDTTLAGPLISTNSPPVALCPQPPAPQSGQNSGPLLTYARNLQNRVYVLSLFYQVESVKNSSDPNLPKAVNQVWLELHAAQSWGTFITKSSGTLTGVWDANNQLDLADMANAYAIGYDWCYNAFTGTGGYPTQQDRNSILNSISQQALAEDDGGDGNPTGKGNQLLAWPFSGTTIEGNWGLICNGGAILAALAVDKDEVNGGYPNGNLGANVPQADAVLNTIFTGTATTTGTITGTPFPYIRSMTEFALPTGSFAAGGWDEGPAYWGESVKYLSLIFAGLETTAGTDYNLDLMPGISSTDSFIANDTGPLGLTFNFSDSNQSNYNLPAIQYLGLKYNQAQYSFPENIATDSAGHYPTDMLWYDPRVESWSASQWSQTAFSAAYNMGMISLRSAWGTGTTTYTNANAVYVGIKAGYNANVPTPTVEHISDQIGSFVFDALGVRWASQLGSDEYNGYPTGYFDLVASDSFPTRWSYYRTRAEGNNTLVIKPTNAGGQYSYGTATVTDLVSTGTTQMAIIDMTAAYDMADNLTAKTPTGTATPVTSAKRGFQILPGSTGYSDIMEMQDEVMTSSAQPLWWFMHTLVPSGDIAITQANTQTGAPSTALLTDPTTGNKLLVTLQRPVGASFQPAPMADTQFSGEPIPSGQNPNTNLVKLGINVTTASTGTTTVNVVMAPYTATQGSNPTPLPTPTALSSW